MTQNSDTEKYDRKTPREHVLLRPDTYIGSVEEITEDMWVYSDEKMIKKPITYIPGLYKIYDEILMNARDASVNDLTCNIIKIHCNKEDGSICVYNNGDDGIPVEQHTIHNVLVPTMIFGELLTGSNYNDNEERITGGRNGLGATCANIFSKQFIVEIDDAKRSKRYKQIWSDNMNIVNNPIIKKLPAKTKSSVKITFYPDYERFGLDGMNEDHFQLFHKKAYDIAGTAMNKLIVYFNDSKIDISNFKNYINLYFTNDKVLYENDNERWTVGVIYNNKENGNTGEVISFVNGIHTLKGGTHVNHVIDNIAKTLINDYIKKKDKDKDLKIYPSMIKERLIFFINSVIINPSFSSQTKEVLTTKTDKFGSKYEPSINFLKKIAKCGIVEEIIELVKTKSKDSLKKTDGKKQTRIIGIPKLEDANKAGTKESNKTCLILTEGDSAKATAMAGVSVIGRDYFGIMSLKGKMLNARDASPAQLLGNEEIKALKIIIGLKQNEDYTDDSAFNTLRYGRVLLFVDADVDGSHIKGLFINFIHSLWPSLIKRNFIVGIGTPIVKATKSTNILCFYNLTDYNKWKMTRESNGFKCKYLKGIGSSSSEEARGYFTDIENKLISYIHENEEDDESILLAFDKTKADERKKWLMSYDYNEILSNDQKLVRYHEFIHKDLKHFSNEDLLRSIPSAIDGLKVSQRKIIYGAFHKNLLKEELKVIQMAGYISNITLYKNGETSLMEAIVGLAQTFVGSNNLNLLKGHGQFGSRLMGGKDHASSRYIYVQLEEVTPIIFQQVDNNIINYQTDDGITVEPTYYVPIIPQILCNGTIGIGSGYSSKIPPYNPIDIINNVKNLINDKPLVKMHPWWRGFEGTVTQVDEMVYELRGKWHMDSSGSKIIIEELPPSEWTTSYKEFLEKLLEENGGSGTGTGRKKKTTTTNGLLSYTNNNTDTRIYFELTFEKDFLQKCDDIEKMLHLCKKYSITNMHLFNANGCIKKYDTPEEIMKDHYAVRLEMYDKRKKYHLNLLEKQLKLISFKVKFVLMIIKKELDINNKKKIDIESELEHLEFPKLSKGNDDDKESYDYLLTLPLYNLTYEKVEELKKQEKEKEIEYETLKNKDIKTIWLEELDHLLKVYMETMVDTKDTTPTKTTKTKRIKK